MNITATTYLNDIATDHQESTTTNFNKDAETIKSGSSESLKSAATIDGAITATPAIDDNKHHQQRRSSPNIIASTDNSCPEFTNTEASNQINLQSTTTVSNSEEESLDCGRTTTSTALLVTTSASSIKFRARRTSLPPISRTSAFKIGDVVALGNKNHSNNIPNNSRADSEGKHGAPLIGTEFSTGLDDDGVLDTPQRQKCGDGGSGSTPDACGVLAAVERRFGCAHYKRRAMFVTPCCKKFYKCRFCHDENESHHFDRKTLTELICSECNTRQKVQESCEKCGVRFGKYTCLICNLFDDDTSKQQYHCDACGICRIGGAENFFHCEVCNMCLPIQMQIDGHRCVENISRSHCPVCLGDIHTSRIPCHIPDCGHLLHKMCFDQLLASGHYTCPTCQTSLIDMSALSKFVNCSYEFRIWNGTKWNWCSFTYDEIWDYLDAQAERMPIPMKHENQRIHIFCNDCHKTSKTKFHFIGLKCLQCGAYNTTQDVKRRMSLVTDEPTTA